MLTSTRGTELRNRMEKELETDLGLRKGIRRKKKRLFGQGLKEQVRS